MTTHLVVGSRSELKLAAVRAALKRARRHAVVIGASTESDVPVQPTEGETEIGARTRARFAQLAQPGSWSVGIENGLFRKRKRWLDKAVVVLRAPDGREWTAESKAVAFPDDAVEEARKRGFDVTTAGTVLAERTGGDPTDPHKAVGGVSRAVLLEYALARLFRECLPGKEAR